MESESEIKAKTLKQKEKGTWIALNKESLSCGIADAAEMFAVLILLIAAQSGWSCMPGYGRERMKLKEYLGIEWIEHGLDATGQNDEKTVRRPADLDCNFDDPKKCRWRNILDAEGLDSLDFHLFEKIDYTEFPILQVRPGPPKLAPGDKLIFTGDKKDQERTAILLSSPIGCQNSSGHLAFTFWLYNGAGVEVLILEKQNGKIVVLPEKPYVDCGPVHLNTECTAEIPARETPFYEFSLGISAFGIDTKEGSFAMIDNIAYRATLCRVAIDLGENFSGKPFVVKPEQPALQSADQLNCRNFDENCRWKSTGHAKEMWQVAGKAPPQNLMFQATGTSVVPEPPFLYLYVEQGHDGPLNVLQSDLIQCQSEQDSKFSFRFWATPRVSLEVCATNISLHELECFPVPMTRSPAFVDFSFKVTSQFTITIKVKNVHPEVDSFIAIDDLQYKAVFCTEALDGWDLGAKFFTTPMLSALLHRPINNAKSLDCTFLHRGVDCMWASEDGTQPLWTVGSTPLNLFKFRSLTGTTQIPDGEFGVVRLQEGQATNLISEPVRCLASEGMLSFRFWQTGAARLSVCLLEDKFPELIDCQKITIPQPGPAIVDLPDMKQPFRIAFRAESENKGMVILDDIHFEGDVCSTTVRAQGVRMSSNSITVQAPDTNVCYLLSCSFEEGQSCLYKSGSIGTSQSRFRASDTYTAANLFLKGKIAVLESPPFNLNTVARVHFSYKKELGISLLFICQDSATKELENCYQVGRNITATGVWIEDYMELIPSDIKFYFIAKLPDDSRRARVLISNIFLTDIENNRVCT